MPEFWGDGGEHDQQAFNAELFDALAKHWSHIISVLSFSGDRDGFALWCATCDGIPSSAFNPPSPPREPRPGDPPF